MEEKFEQVEKKLKKAGQEHLLKYYERITDDKKKENFLNSILTIDFDAINEIYLDSKKNITNKDFVIEPIKFIDKEKIDEKEYAEYEKLGKEIIKSGKLAVVTMAGGQGTRLGHTGPKGTFDLGLESHKSIFEILCDTLKSENERYGVSVPWYIMTSDENNTETVEFFEKHNYFGYNKGDIFFFIYNIKCKLWRIYNIILLFSSLVIFIDYIHEIVYYTFSVIIFNIILYIITIKKSYI